jgi:hemoglobin/transferrin/lactoferrin receptor protein
MTCGVLCSLGANRAAAYLWGGTALAVLLFAGTAYTQQSDIVQADRAARLFDIPSLPVLGAISAFNRQSGLQVTLPAGVGSNARTNPVKGSYRPEVALARMFEGTGVSYAIGDAAQAILSASDGTSGEAATTLRPIVIVGKSGRDANAGAGFQGTPDWVYDEAGSVSVVSRQAIQNSAARNANDVLDNVAGVLTNRSESQNPGISISVRGLQDQNRVATSIDGARQSFQRTSHGSSQRVYVDTAFIRAIEVEKGGVSGVGGAGALGGSVNFRTIEADDIIQAERRWGVEVDATTGTNAYNFNGSIAGAVRLSDDFSILGGVAHKNIGDYEYGKNGTITQLDELGSGTARNDAVIFSGMEWTTTLLKAEGNLSDDLSFDLSWMRNDADSQQGSYGVDDVLRSDDQTVVNDTVTASFTWDPGSDLINLQGRLWYNNLKNDEQRGYADGALPLTYGMESFGASLENTSQVDTSIGLLSLNYGFEGFRDNGETKTPVLLDENGYDGAYGFKGANPSGQRDTLSGFANATLEHDDWLTFTGGLRYDYYRLTGSTVVHGWEQTVVGTPGVNCLLWRNGTCFRWQIPPSQTIVNSYPQYPVDVDMSGGAWLPSATVAVKPFDWLQPFVKYARTYRPPAITEALISGGHPLVAPLENAPNPWLRPESADTFEIGANITQDAVFSADDSFRMKTVLFYRNVKDYISMGTIFNEQAGRLYNTHVNLDGTTHMKGVEIEANYDAGGYYIGGSFTWLHTDFAETYVYQGIDTGPWTGGGTYPATPAILFAPPKTKFTIDAGVRLLEQKLVVGGRLTHVGGSEPAYGQLVGNYLTEDYTLLDIYGSYAFSDSVKLRFAVNNVTDKAYVPSLGTASFPAPGRTMTASLNFKF